MQSTDSCGVDRCDRPAKRVGLCGAHYQQRRAGKEFSLRPAHVSCVDCHVLVSVGSHGPLPKFCGGCTSIRALGSGKRARAMSSTESFCREAGCTVIVHRKVGKRGAALCDAHRDERRRALPRDSMVHVCIEAECHRPVRARGVCNMHYKQILRAEGRIAEAPWNDRRRSNHQARRARKLGSTVTSAALLIDIIERDGTDCAGCGDGVDLSVKWPDPFSKSVDHVVPLSRGGAHSLENCQLMHLRCNISKGARIAT